MSYPVCYVSCRRYCNNKMSSFLIKTRGIKIQKQTYEFVAYFSVYLIDSIIIGTSPYFLGDCTLGINRK